MGDRNKNMGIILAKLQKEASKSSSRELICNFGRLKSNWLDGYTISQLMAMLSSHTDDELEDIAATTDALLIIAPDQVNAPISQAARELFWIYWKQGRAVSERIYKILDSLKRDDAQEALRRAFMRLLSWESGRRYKEALCIFCGLDDYPDDPYELIQADAWSVTTAHRSCLEIHDPSFAEGLRREDERCAEAKRRAEAGLPPEE